MCKIKVDLNYMYTCDMTPITAASRDLFTLVTPHTVRPTAIAPKMNTLLHANAHKKVQIPQ